MTHSTPLLCDRDHSLLLMVDLQEKLLSAMEADERVQVLGTAKRLLRAATELDVPMVATEQYPKGLGATVPELKALLPAAARGFEKTCFSCCGADGFPQALPADRPQVVLFGIEAHVCILQTALDLQARGRQVFVVEDGTCSRHPGHKANALARLRQAGVTVTNSESVLFEWLRDARHESFKAVSALLKP
ncbi:MAG TPA: hydrolase [Gammaproteobacteria bacterium]|nr:hydrolase [Gammaproteobacteria bacterium]